MREPDPIGKQARGPESASQARRAWPRGRWRLLFAVVCVVLGALLFLGVFHLQRGDVDQQAISAASAAWLPRAPWKKADVLGDGWRVVDTVAHQEFVRFTAEKQGRRTAVEISFKRTGASPWTTRHYLVQPAPGSAPPKALLRAVKRALTRIEARPGHRPFVRPIAWTSVPTATSPVAWHEPRQLGTDALMVRLRANSTLLLQIVLVLALLLGACRTGAILRLARGVSRIDWALLTAWTLLGAGLRLLGGTRVPGFTNSAGHAHGFSVLRDILVHDPLLRDPHGSGLHAVHGLTTLLLPRTESAVIAVQYGLSVACIPLCYGVARLWLRRADTARWAAAVMAVLPCVVYFATTEIRLLPGVFFLLLTLSFLGLAVRDRHPVTLFATALLAVATSQFYPILMLFPVLMLLLLLATPPGRELLKTPWSWAAASLLTALWLLPALWIACLITTRTDTVVGGGFLRVFDQWHALFLPAMHVDRTQVYNVFLNAQLTPPLLPILAVLGAIAGCRNRGGRAIVICVIVSALVLTLPGLFIGRLNLARLQQGAQPFYAMLAGVGAATLVDALDRVVKRRWVASTAVAVALLGSLAIWPGAIGRHHTLQAERRFFQSALGRLKDGCVVVWAPTAEMGTNHSGLPTYLADERGRRLSWGALRTAQVPPGLLETESRCLIYYRGSTCYGERAGQPRRQLLHPLCARIESQLELTPLVVGTLPNRPDDALDYKGRSIEVGFFRVTRIAPPKL